MCFTSSILNTKQILKLFRQDLCLKLTNLSLNFVYKIIASFDSFVNSIFFFYFVSNPSHLFVLTEIQPDFSIKANASFKLSKSVSIL